MKKIFQYITMAVAVVAMASCSQEDMFAPATTQGMQFCVSEFPTFGDSHTRTIGTPEEGKTAWTSGDALLLSFKSSKYGVQTATLTYTASQWTVTENVTFEYLQGETPEITVLYAPCYTFNASGNLVSGDAKAGTCEYLQGTGTMSADGKSVSINFDARTYSRLRISAEAGKELTVTTTGFTPAGATAAATTVYTLTTNTKGNAFLYGVFAADGKVKVETNGVLYADYTFEETTEVRKSYALDALKDPGYTYDESTNTYFVKNADGLYAWNNAVQAIMSTGSDSDGDDFAEYSKSLPNLTLTADIIFLRDDAITNWTPVGGYKNYVYYPYTGTIDGGGHKISGLYMYNDIVDYSGFLGVISNSVVKDLTFDDCYIITSNDDSSEPYCVAFVVGESYNSEITNCHITKSEISLPKGKVIAGVVSWLYDGIVSGCSVDENTIISGQESVAGVVCYNWGGVVSGCINEATVKGNSYVGGVVVENTDSGYGDGVVIACGNTGELLSDKQSRKYFGGIVADCSYFFPVYGSWTINTLEYDDTGNEPALNDGVGYIGDERYVYGCYSGDGSYITEYLEYMNYFINEYNKSADEGRKCIYKWNNAGDSNYPNLKKITE